MAVGCCRSSTLSGYLRMPGDLLSGMFFIMLCLFHVLKVKQIEKNANLYKLIRTYFLQGVMCPH